MNLRDIFTAGVVVLPLVTTHVHAEERTIGEVTTSLQLLQSHIVRIGAIQDPDISAITCHYSRPVTGGLAGAVGLAEDKSDISLACRLTAPITCKIEDDKMTVYNVQPDGSFIPAIILANDGENDDGVEIFNKSLSIFSKDFHVSRFYDPKSHTLVYLSWSDKLIDGSPKSSISTVPLGMVCN